MAELVTLQALLKRSARLYGDKAAFHLLDRDVSYSDFANDVEMLGTGLIASGLRGKKIGVIGKNSYEWGLVYFAVMNIGGIIVPLDKELTAEELSGSIDRVKPKAIFYSEDIAHKIDSISNLAHTTSFIPMWNKPKTMTLNHVMSEGGLLLRKGDRGYGKISIKPDTCAALLFTSGTTSQSKIVMLSQRNIMLDMQRGVRPFGIVPDDKFLSILPLHHMFECNAGFLAPLYSGASIYFSQGIRYIADEFKKQQPTVVICVPRVIEALSTKIWKGIRAKNKVLLVRTLTRTANILGKFSPSLKRRIFSQIHEELGGKIRMFLSGAAPLNLQTAAGMSGLGFTVFQGYGLTECAPAVALTHFHNDDPDSVGPPIKGTSIRILHPDENGIGEVAVKGPQVMLGYYKNTKATRAALQGDYFHTGDLGYIKANGCLKIVGRSKNIIVTSSGKKIYPEEIEALLASSVAIKDVVVHSIGNDHRQKICASIVLPDSSTPAELIKFEAEARRHIESVNATLSNYEQIQTVKIRSEDFVRTSTLKIKRHLLES